MSRSYPDDICLYQRPTFPFSGKFLSSVSALLRLCSEPHEDRPDNAVTRTLPRPVGLDPFTDCVTPEGLCGCVRRMWSGGSCEVTDGNDHNNRAGFHRVSIYSFTSSSVWVYAVGSYVQRFISTPTTSTQNSPFCSFQPQNTDELLMRGKVLVLMFLRRRLDFLSLSGVWSVVPALARLTFCGVW